jgi:hypothetical protein
MGDGFGFGATGFGVARVLSATKLSFLYKAFNRNSLAVQQIGEIYDRSSKSDRYPA